MAGSSLVRAAGKWLLVVLAAGILSIAALLAALDAGYFHQPSIRFIAARTGRHIEVDGPVTLRLFSLSPQVFAEQVTIGNPPWTPPGILAKIGKISLVFELPRPGRSFGIKRLEMDGATLHLVRDSTGHANWQQTDPDKNQPKDLPVIQSVSMPRAHVTLEDARRHLQFDGLVSAGEPARGKGLPFLKIDGAGRLNLRAATFEILGDPLAIANHDKPYRFSFAERSSGSRLIGWGSLPRPFDFTSLDTTFDARGEDLKDLFFLTGVTLIDTGSYHVSGKFTRRGALSTFGDLAATSGQSDVRGNVTIDTSTGRRELAADLDCELLRLSDLGARAAGREATIETGTPLLLSNAKLVPATVRSGDAAVNFHARRVDIGRVPFHSVAFHMTIDHGTLAIAPLSAELLGGKVIGRLKLDAMTNVPPVDLELKFSDVQLGQMTMKGPGPPPIEGLLRARVTLKGQGRSLHEVAANANGVVTVVLPRGTLRASVAALAGLDLRGLGLLLTRDTEAVNVRCAVASFKAQGGLFTAQSLVMDTDSVLVSGEGQVNFNSEALDLDFLGHPKTLRLFRVRSPVLLRGTLTHPSINIQARGPVVQAAEAVALGVVLTPLASVLAFVDPGLAKDADCASLLAAAETHAHAPQTTHSAPGGNTAAPRQ